MSSDEFTVVTLGEIKNNLKYVVNRKVYPLGFKVERKMRSYMKPRTDTVFTSEVRECGPSGNPSFVVRAADDPDNPVIMDSPNDAWKKMLERRGGTHPSTNVRGAMYFGLENAQILAQVTALPGAAELLEESRKSGADRKEKRARGGDGKQKTDSADEGNDTGEDAPPAEGADGEEGKTDVSSSKKRSTKKKDDDSKKEVKEKKGGKEKGKPPLCDKCGLDAPFCAVSGEAHEVAPLPTPCVECGLTSPFCPVTGKKHDAKPTKEKSSKKSSEASKTDAGSKPKPTRKKAEKAPRLTDSSEDEPVAKILAKEEPKLLPAFPRIYWTDVKREIDRHRDTIAEGIDDPQRKEFFMKQWFLFLTEQEKVTLCAERLARGDEVQESKE